MIVKTTHRCDWPGCEATVEAGPGLTELSDLRWETRCGGEKLVCPDHRFRSSMELMLATQPPAACPFCDGTEIGVESVVAACDDDIWFYVECQGCRAGGPWSRNRDGARITWNDRAE